MLGEANRRLSARGYGSQLVERLSDESREVLLVGLLDIAFKCDLEDGDPRLSGQARGWIVDPRRRNAAASAAASDASLISSLLKLRARGNDGLALPRELPALLDESTGGPETRDCRVDRRQ